MDGVLADFDAEVHSRVAERHPDIRPLDPFPEIPDFYVSRHYPEEHYDTVRGISNEQGFFASLPMIPDAAYGWERVMRLGFRPQICSSPISTNPYSKEEKLGWLEENLAPLFGSWVVSTAIITRDKHLVSGAVLIDDRPAIQHAETATWQHIIFDQPANRGITGPTIRRLKTWRDPNLPQLLRQSAQITS